MIPAETKVVRKAVERDLKAETDLHIAYVKAIASASAGRRL
jgi:hypothetical protein